MSVATMPLTWYLPAPWGRLTVYGVPGELSEIAEQITAILIGWTIP